MKRVSEPESLVCSFCHKPQSAVGKLICSPGDAARAYICNECIAVCNAILQDDQIDMTAKASPLAAIVPDPSEYAPYYGRYISLVPSGDIVTTLERQAPGTCALLSTLTDADGDYRYAPGKWSVKEVLGHVIDSERIFAYRALRIARHDRTPLPGFEQDDYVQHGAFGGQRVPDLLAELSCVRRATVLLFRKLPAEAWDRRGIASDNEVSVRAIAYIIAGHELHHRKVLEEKYFRV